jgi:hypothetical protein
MEERHLLEDFGEIKILLNWIKAKDGSTWTGCTWLRTGINGGSL